MENCLVKKFKSVVNNSNLKSYLNGLLISNIQSNSSLVFNRVSGKEVSIKMLSGTGTFSINSSGEYTEYTMINTNATVKCTNASASNPYTLLVTGIDGLTGELNLTDATCVVMLDELYQLPGITKLNIGKKFIGELKSIADMESISTIVIRPTFSSGETFTPTGKVDDIFDALVEKGKTGTYYLSIAASFSNVPHSSAFAYESYGTYTISVTNSGWSVTSFA